MKKKTKDYWIKTKRVNLEIARFEGVDILAFYWGKKTEHSREIKTNLLIDFDKNDNIVGLEIFDFGYALAESQKIIDEIFKSKKSKSLKQRNQKEGHHESRNRTNN